MDARHGTNGSASTGGRGGNGGSDHAVAGAAVAAIVLGIVGLMAVFIPVVGVVIGGLAGLAGLAAGLIGRRASSDPNSTNRSVANAGIVTSAIVLVFVVILALGLAVFTPIGPGDYLERMDGLGGQILGVADLIR